MALIFVDGFAANSGSVSLLDKWSATSGGGNACPLAASDIRAGAFHCYGPTTGAQTQKYLPSTHTTLVAGLSYKPLSLPVFFLAFKNAATYLLTFTVDSSGSIEARLGSSTGTVLASSASGAIVASGWHYIECKVVIDDSSGSIECRVNGIEVLSITGIDTRLTTDVDINNIQVNGAGYWTDVYIDDANFHALSGRGCRIDTLWPTGAGTYSQMTPSAGSNYECIDDGRVSANDDTDYVSSDALNEIDSYTFEDISAIGTDITAVAHSIIARQDEVGEVGVSNVTRVNGSDFVGDENTINTSHLEYQNIMELNPDDSAAWEEADINAAEFGQKRTT